MSDYRKDLQLWFGLSRSSFAVLPRVAMEAMPKEWQEKMSELLFQYDDTINTSAFGVDSCFVTAKGSDNKFIKMPEEWLNYRHPRPEVIAEILSK